MNSAATPVFRVTDINRGEKRAPFTGRVLSARYELERELGRGGMAIVYLATDRTTGAPVAVKILHPELAFALGAGRFLREVQIIKRLDHPNILKLLDSGVEDGDAYYVMPYVVGGTLRERLLQRTQLSVEETIEHGKGLAAGLAHAHSAGVVHRDVKPENILLDNGRAILADFGIARLVAASGAERHLSTTGLVIGTPAYMSPEQATADPKTDARSDLYSLGCVMFEMLSGIPPFAGATPQAVAARHLVEAPPSIRVVRPNAPDGIASIIERCLAKSPADRFQDAAELTKAIETGALTRVVPSAKRWAVPVSILAVVALMAVWFAPSASSLDESRYVVFPFRSLGDSPPALLQPKNIAFLVYEALAPARDIHLVDRARLESAMSEAGAVSTLTDAVSLARSLGAGRFIWGEVVGRGDSVLVRGQMYRTGDGGNDPLTTTRFIISRGDAASAGAGAQEFFGRFVQMARALVVRQLGADSTSYLGTDFMGAVAEKLTGDSARIAWNLPLAAAQYRRALAIDPQYAQANFGAAQVDAWLERPEPEWRETARAAVARSSSLSLRERTLASGLLAMAEERYLDACRSYSSLAERDSTDFEAWFGVGECHARDPIVVASSGSPSGFAFRASYRTAAQAYLHALRVVPLSHRADRVMSVGRLERVLPTGVALRSGSSDEPASLRFLAWPGMTADTIEFVPYRWEAFNGKQAPAEPRNMDALFLRNRQLLSAYSAEWIQAFPRSAAAWHARAEQLERLGALDGDSSASARFAIARARRLTTDRADARLVIDEARILFRLRDSKALGTLIDSIARTTISSPQVALELAPLAALSGNERWLRTLLSTANLVWRFRALGGEPLLAPRPVVAAALDLYWYAMVGGSSDSLAVFENALARAVDLWSPPNRRERDLESLRYVPALLGFPVFGIRAAHRSALAPQELVRQRQVVEGSADVRRAILDDARRLSSLPVSDVAPETAYLAAYSLLIGGDTISSRMLLARTLGQLDGLPMTMLLTPQGPAALRRAMTLLPSEGDPAVRSSRQLLTAISRPN